MDHFHKVPQWLREPGTEIGAFKTPIPGINPVYVDKYAEFANQRCLGDYYGEAIDLPFRSNSLNYVASSHVLEHVANPVRALQEWFRVLRPGGVIYMVVPDKRHTWDHARESTPIVHFLEDYRRKTTSADATHIDDFVDNVDWSTYSPGTPAGNVPDEKRKLKELYHHAVSHRSEINIHFHVFTLETITGLLEAVKKDAGIGFDGRLVDSAERFPKDNPIGFLAVIRVRKGWRDRLEGWRNRLRYSRDPKSILLPTARAFPKA